MSSFHLLHRRWSATAVLVAINLVLFFITEIWPGLLVYLALRLDLFWQKHFYWTVLSYMFVHDGLAHIAFNLLPLAIIGPKMEGKMGRREFLFFYLFCGVASGLISLVIYHLSGSMVWLLGASGAIYGLLFGFAVFFPDTVIFLFGILPLRPFTLVLLFTVMALFSQITGSGGNIAHWTHLAGFAVAFFYLWLRLKSNPLRRFIR